MEKTWFPKIESAPFWSEWGIGLIFDVFFFCWVDLVGFTEVTPLAKQEAHGPRFAHLSDIATADMQMFPIIYAKIQP